MPTLDVLEKFIAKVEANEHDDAIEDFYTEDASMQENQSEPKVGRNALVSNEKKVLSRTKSMKSKCIRPVFVNGDYVVIRWVFRFDWLDGTTTEMEEIAYQQWKGNQICKEQFFYDPAQRLPK